MVYRWENLCSPLQTTRTFSEQLVIVLNYVVEAGEVPLQEFVGYINDLRELISRGLLRLKISIHVWGVEYLVTSPITPQSRDLEPK